MVSDAMSRGAAKESSAAPRLILVVNEKPRPSAVATLYRRSAACESPSTFDINVWAAMATYNYVGFRLASGAVQIAISYVFSNI
jgi:hypothetical protein